MRCGHGGASLHDEVLRVIRDFMSPNLEGPRRKDVHSRGNDIGFQNATIEQAWTSRGKARNGRRWPSSIVCALKCYCSCSILVCRIIVQDLKGVAVGDMDGGDAIGVGVQGVPIPWVVHDNDGSPTGGLHDVGLLCFINVAGATQNHFPNDVEASHRSILT
ncbi:hypothetical protein IEQ34_008909 [Dendrobium chrysotoxum]|uniref:Uncharacterized protein n=1 Tax=Dendrobium chrysotoxum TaxID=161865 RepID=A0AAV7GZX9_DENCH|nr:hypothetical protein IEQ34_008909 [Dendrobium chrysotoxum]